jgi:hypothetical protein
VNDKEQRAELSGVFVEERAQLGVPAPAEDDLLVEFYLDSCLLTRTTGHGDPAPRHPVWRDR